MANFRSVDGVNTWDRWFNWAFENWTGKALELKLWEKSPYHQRRAISEFLGIPVYNTTLTERLGKSRIYDKEKLKNALGSATYEPGGKNRKINLGAASVERLLDRDTSPFVIRDKTFLRARSAWIGYHETAEQISSVFAENLNYRADKLERYISKRYRTPIVSHGIDAEGTEILTGLPGITPKGSRLLTQIENRVQGIHAETLSLAHRTRHVLDFEARVVGKLEPMLGKTYVQAVSGMRRSAELESSLVFGGEKAERGWGYIERYDRNLAKGRANQVALGFNKRVSASMLRMEKNLSKLGAGSMASNKMVRWLRKIIK